MSDKTAKDAFVTAADIAKHAIGSVKGGPNASLISPYSLNEVFASGEGGRNNITTHGRYAYVAAAGGHNTVKIDDGLIAPGVTGQGVNADVYFQPAARFNTVMVKPGDAVTVSGLNETDSVVFRGAKLDTSDFNINTSATGVVTINETLPGSKGQPTDFASVNTSGSLPTRVDVSANGVTFSGFVSNPNFHM